MMKLQRESLSLAVVFGLTMAIGMSLALQSRDGVVYFYTQSGERDPAAIQKRNDFSHLSGSALQLATQERLMATAKVVRSHARTGIELGHFVVGDPTGKKLFACQAYDKIEMGFSSADSAVSGRPSKMTVVSDCIPGKDVNRISPVWIPVAKILSQQAGDVELQFMDEEKVDLRFENMGTQWPSQWNLEHVRLYDSTYKKPSVNVNRDQIQSLRKDPIRLQWQQRIPSGKNTNSY